MIRDARRMSATVVMDKPMPTVLELGIDRISELIRSVTGPFEDSFQDAWERILGDYCATEDDVLKIAREVSAENAKRASGEKYQLRSLNAPLTSGVAENDGEPLTLEDVLPHSPERSDEEIDASIDAQQPHYRGIGHRNTHGNTHLDEDTLRQLQARFPHEPVNRAIRKLVGLPLADDRRAWSAWEDALLRQRYPWGGRFAVAVDINRSYKAIEQRAKHLGVKRVGGAYKPIPDWFRVDEVTKLLGASDKIVRRWIKLGYLKVVEVDGHRNIGRDVFITPQGLRDFISNHPFVYSPERIGDEYRQFIPVTRSGWVTTQEAAKLLSVSQTTIVNVARRGDIKKVSGWLGRWYVNLEDVKRWVVQPYPVVATGASSPTHYLFHSDGQGSHFLACRPHTPEGLVHPVTGKHIYPTCLMCLNILGKWRKSRILLPQLADVYKPKECMICRKPRAESKPYCQEHDEMLFRQNRKCLYAGCEAQRLSRNLYCKQHQAKATEHWNRPNLELRARYTDALRKVSRQHSGELRKVSRQIIKMLNSLAAHNYHQPTRLKRIEKIKALLVTWQNP